MVCREGEWVRMQVAKEGMLPASRRLRPQMRVSSGEEGGDWGDVVGSEEEMGEASV